MRINVTSNDVWSAVTRLTTEWATNEYISIGIVSIFVPFIFCSNAMVVVSVTKYKRLHTPTNYFIMSLAVADIIIAIALPFYVAVELTPIHLTDNILCLAANRMLMAAGGVSILTLSIIAYDRYTALTYPLEYIMIMTKNKIFGFVLFSWIYSGIFTWLPVIIRWHGNIKDHSSMCSNSVLDSKSRILFICAIFVPACSCILFCYFRIFVIARHHARAIAAVENLLRQSLERQFVKNDTKYAKTIAIIIGVFLSLWLPYQICLLLEFLEYREQNQWTKNYLMLLAFANSGVNPWIYAYQNNDFRSAYRIISQFWRCRRRIDIEDRRSSVISQISILPTGSFYRLNRANSRVIASDILYTLSRQLGKDNVENALNTRLSTTHGVVNAVSSLPDLLKLYTNTYPPNTQTNPSLGVRILEEESCSEQGTIAEDVSKDSAYSMDEFPSDVTN